MRNCAFFEVGYQTELRVGIKIEEFVAVFSAYPTETLHNHLF